MIRHFRFLAQGFLLVAATGLLGGCFYTDIQIPRAYRSASPVDVASQSDKVVTGKGCNQFVLYMVAWGEGGYAAAVRNALSGEPPGSILYDVQADMEATAYMMGFYTKTCTVVTGKVGNRRIKAAPFEVR